MDVTDVFSQSHDLPENVVSYSLHGYSKGNVALDELRSQCLACISRHVVDYIWQREPFVLHSSIDAAPPWRDKKKSGHCLWGRVRFGDSVEDEWFIVSLLQCITASIANLAAKVWDDDGEFLLIEAAFHIPKWVKPDESDNRVWIAGGVLHLVSKNRSGKGRSRGEISIAEALDAIREGGTEAKENVQACIMERTESFANGGACNLHWARCRLPASVALVLKLSPQLVSHAVRAFIHRDRDDMKAVSKMAKFPCTELVTTMINMHRCSYAQLAQQEFGPPRGYRMPNREDKEFKASDVGLKITCGMEILYQGSAACMNMGEKNDDQLDVMPGWEAFMESLQRNGYFGENIPGSTRHKELLSKASASFMACSGQASKSTERASIALEIDDTLKDCDGKNTSFPSEELFSEDDDSWLYLGHSDLDIELKKRNKELDEGVQPGGGFHEDDAFDPEQLVDGLKAFVNKLSSHEGAEVPQENFGDISFDASKFVSELRGALGVIDDHVPDATSESESDESSLSFDEENLKGVSKEMEADQSSDRWEVETATDSDDDNVDSKEFNQAYSAAMNQELSGSKLASSFAVDSHEGEHTNTSVGIDNGLTPVDVDINLVKGLLESYSSQNGVAGPVGNLLGMMDMKLPSQSENREPRSQ